MKNRFSILCFCFVWVCHAGHAQTLECDNPLLSLNPKGEILAGSRTAVVDAHRRGQWLRVGWGLDFDQDGSLDITHWSDALFTSEWQGEVFTQVQQIHRQRPKRGEPNIYLSEEPQIWTAIIGTNGILRGRLMDSDTVGENPVSSQWCLATQPKTPVCTQGWQMVFHNDKQGRVLGGSKEQLLQSIRRGFPIRLAWGARSETREGAAVEHVVDAGFLTVASQEEVFAQVPTHTMQQSYWNPDQSRFAKPLNIWSGRLGTDGSFDAVQIDPTTGETVRHRPQRAEVTWLANVTCPLPPTLELAVPKGVIAVETE